MISGRWAGGVVASSGFSNAVAPSRVSGPSGAVASATALAVAWPSVSMIGARAVVWSGKCDCSPGGGPPVTSGG